MCQSIIYILEEKLLLLYWSKEIHEGEFGHDDAHDISDSSQFDISKMGKGGAMTKYTCNPARLLSSKLATYMTEVAKDKAIADCEDGSNVLMKPID